MSTRNLAAVAAVALLGTITVGPSMAQPNRFDRDRGPDIQDRIEDAYKDGYRAGFDDARGRRRFDDRYVSTAAPPPPPGPPPRADRDRENRWRARYARTYTRDDDSFYRECRQTVDPAGVIVGGLIGGLLGNAIGRGNGGATIAGVVVGGVTGAALTRNLDCEDRSYAYKTYSDGFNSGRSNATYRWTNPRNNHRGDFVVGDYYDDPDGFRCATYTQRIYISGQPQTASGRACQQPDGAWTIVG